MQRIEKAPVGHGTASGGNRSIPIQKIAETSVAGKRQPLLSLPELYQNRKEILIRMERLKREALWTKQRIRELREEYSDNQFALNAIDGLILMAIADGKEALA